MLTQRTKTSPLMLIIRYSIALINSLLVQASRSTKTRAKAWYLSRMVKPMMNSRNDCLMNTRSFAQARRTMMSRPETGIRTWNKDQIQAKRVPMRPSLRTFNKCQLLTHSPTSTKCLNSNSSYLLCIIWMCTNLHLLSTIVLQMKLWLRSKRFRNNFQRNSKQVLNLNLQLLPLKMLQADNLQAYFPTMKEAIVNTQTIVATAPISNSWVSSTNKKRNPVHPVPRNISNSNHNHICKGISTSLSNSWLINKNNHQWQQDLDS